MNDAHPSRDARAPDDTRDATMPLAQPSRAAYHAPALRVFGDLARLTAKVGFKSTTTDGGFFGFVKTK